MVTLKNQQMAGHGKDAAPIMHAHMLTCLRSIGTFEADETFNCLIAKYDNGRYAVFPVDTRLNKYAVLRDLDDLNFHFAE